jgi:hypothetical protein
MSILKEDNGTYSMMRLLSIIIVVSGVAVGLILALTGKLDVNGVALSLGLVTVGLTGKTVSKKLEA